MDAIVSLSRRRLLASQSSLLALAALAGCGGESGDATGDDPTTDDTATGERTEPDTAADADTSDGRTTTEEDTGDGRATTGEDTGDGATTAAETEGAAETADPTPGTPDTATATDGGTDDGGLDRREANVVGVAVEGGNGTYTVDVALHHDDDGEDGYANWWQVERLDGTQLGRRELLHPHSQQPFTRSETIEIPDGVGCVVVRGHDQTHGYGGVAVLLDIASGATRSVDQGPEPQSFDASDCP